MDENKSKPTKETKMSKVDAVVAGARKTLAAGLEFRGDLVKMMEFALIVELTEAERSEARRRVLFGDDA